MSAPSTRQRVESALGASVEFASGNDGMTTIVVARDALHDALARLRDRAGFEQVTLVTAVDRLPDEPRFEIVHQLMSYAHNDRVRVKCRVPDEDPRVPTCTDLWPGANYFERECFDLFGVVFDGHKNLKRLLMPDGYDHHPLRKDFPHAGIQPDRLYREWDAQRRARWKEDEPTR